MLDQGRIGQAILATMAQMRQGEAGDLRAVTEGLSTLRHLGLEDLARRSALQLILLERRL
jgi:putative component of toxin-antitoxin plasmid stabilization module